MVVPIRQPCFPFLFTLPAPWVLFYFQILWIQLFWILSLNWNHMCSSVCDHHVTFGIISFRFTAAWFISMTLMNNIVVCVCVVCTCVCACVSVCFSSCVCLCVHVNVCLCICVYFCVWMNIDIHIRGHLGTRSLELLPLSGGLRSTVMSRIHRYIWEGLLPIASSVIPGSCNVKSHFSLTFRFQFPPFCNPTNWAKLSILWASQEPFSLCCLASKSQAKGGRTLCCDSTLSQ